MPTCFRLLLTAAFAALLTTASPASGAAGFGDVEADRYYTAPVQLSLIHISEPTRPY